MASLHPFFDVDVGTGLFLGLDLLGICLALTFKVASEVLQESDFLLQFFGVVINRKLVDSVLSFDSLAFHVLECAKFYFLVLLRPNIKDDLSGIIEEHTRKTITQQVT